MKKLCALLACMVGSDVCAERIYVEADMLASSAAVSLHSMQYGWSSAFQGGDHAYADLRREIGVAGKNWQFGWLQRRYYALRFNSATARFYRDLEQGYDHQGQGRLQLEGEHFIAEGLKLAWSGEQADWHWRAAVSGYWVNHYQFGSLNGNIKDGKASATLDYQFDDDKILDYRADVPAGKGVSLDLQLSRRWKDWRIEMTANDVLNRWWLTDAAFTEGCINFGDTGTQACSSNGVASGRSGQRNIERRIHSRYQAAVAFIPWHLTLTALSHDRYQQFGIQRDWPLALGSVQTALYSDRQLKLAWAGQWSEQQWGISVAADDIRPHYARQARFQVNWSYAW